MTDAITIVSRWPEGHFEEFIADLRKHTARNIRRAINSRVPRPAQTEILKIIRKYNVAPASFPERAAIGVALDLGITDRRILLRIYEAVTFGCMHSDILDDLIDTKAKSYPLRDIYLTHILFNLYVNAWLDMCQPTQSVQYFDKFISAEMETYSALFDEELNHVNRSSPYSSFSVIGQKCAPVKAIMFQVFKLAGSDKCDEILLNAIDRASFGMLIVDDITDWEEDFDELRFTYPIQKAMNRANVRYHHSRHTEVKHIIFKELWFSTLLHEILKEATDSLYEAAKIFSNVSPTLAGWINEFRQNVMSGWSGAVGALMASAEPIHESPLL